MIFEIAVIWLVEKGLFLWDFLKMHKEQKSQIIRNHPMTSYLQKLIRSCYECVYICTSQWASKQGCFFSSSVEAICHHLVQLKATCVQAEYYNTLFPIFSSSKWQWGHFFLVKLPLQQLFVLVSPTVWRLQINNGFFVTLSVSIDICKSFQMIFHTFLMINVSHKYFWNFFLG